jgi:hypothetical protein
MSVERKGEDKREAGKELHRRQEAPAANNGSAIEYSKGVGACAMVG